MAKASPKQHTKASAKKTTQKNDPTSNDVQKSQATDEKTEPKKNLQAQIVERPTETADDRTESKRTYPFQTAIKPTEATDGKTESKRTNRSQTASKYPEPTIEQQVHQLGFDLKAETFTDHMLKNDIAVDINLSDYFKRRFSKDITQIVDEEDNQPLKVHLSRRGFYNILPERFFHTSYSSTPFIETMVADYKNRKIEENQVRKFFKPLEAEFFLQKVAIEHEEDAIFQSLGSRELVHLLKDLWEIDADIPDKMATKILKVMPFLYKIAGNLPLLQKVLEHLIEERIEIERGFASIAYTQEDAPWQLGVNMATVGNPMTFLPKYTFTITDIRRPEAIEGYLPGGKIWEVVKLFLEHTLPYESDFEIDFTIAEQKREFVLNQTVYGGRLGISATI